MERAWAWFRSCFGARVTDRVRNPDRVEHGRIEKSGRLSRSPKRRHTPTTSSPRSKKKHSRPTCEGFAETLLRVVRRDANLKLLNRLAQDINGSIQHLDELIEQEQGRVEAEGDVHKRHALRDWLRKCHADREGLRRDRMRNDRNLQSDTAEQQNDEAIVFDQAAWAMEHCAGQAAVAVLDDEMLLEVDEILNTQDEVALRESTLVAAQEEHADLRAALGNIPARLSHEAAAALDRLSDHLQELETRKAQDSRALLDRKQSLWSHCRQSLLSSGVIELDDGRPIPDPEPVQQDPPPEDVPTYEQFEEARNDLNDMQETHDNRPTLYHDWYNGFMERYPDSTKSVVDRSFYNQCITWARGLKEDEQKFVEIRNRILPSGAQPLRLRYNRARLDFPEYGGHCPSDGKTDSEASKVRRAVKTITELETRPKVESWLEVEPGHPESDPEDSPLPVPMIHLKSYKRLQVSYARKGEAPLLPERPAPDNKEHQQLIDFIQHAEEFQQAIFPWDSASAAERTPYIRGVVDHRRSTERP
ncbi:hypothetical protein KC316_g7974 [Hortaea werneckii]|nr:hypothetical protein KC324_g7414 [Hortaea werneckii]KAI7582254.1 hypothetical protein KC316_g7974 [Hortaea werneckii]